MKTCFKTGAGRIEMIDVPLPEPGPGQIVLRTTVSTICGTDLHIVDEWPADRFAAPPGLPGFPLGHEAVGLVHAVGPGVEKFEVGDRVVPSSLTMCGRCPQCLSGDGSACSGGGSLVTGCQGEYFLVPFADVNVAKIPDDLSDEQAVLVPDLMTTSFGAIERAGLRWGDSVAIFGQGPIGLCATIAARLNGAGLVIAVEPVVERRQAAQLFGANAVINPNEQDPVGEIMRLTDGKGVDVAVEAVGSPAAFEGVNRTVRQGGTISLVGVYLSYPNLTQPTNVRSFMHRRVVSTVCPRGYDLLNRLMDIIRYGQVDVMPLITHRMRMSKLPAAYELFRARREGVLKIAITP